MSNLRVLVLASVLIMASCSGQPGGSSAPPNPTPVPSVVGLSVNEAAPVLRNHDYTCGIFEITESEQPPGRVLIQNPKPGAHGFLAMIVQLVVAAPFSMDQAPETCVDRLEFGGIP